MDFDSKEEMYFQWWIDDLVSAGYIDEVVYQPEPFITADASGPKHLEMKITRAKFNELISEILTKLRTPTENAIKEAEGDLAKAIMSLKG